MTQDNHNLSNSTDGPQASNVVLPVCDDLFGEEILEFVSHYQWRGIPTFHFLFVIETDALRAVAPHLAPEVEEDERKYGSNLIHDLSNLLLKSLPNARIVSHILTGKPIVEILKLADGVNATMIVMGSHGRTGLRKVLLGSVSAAIVEKAQCSTMIVHVRDAQEKSQMPGPMGVSLSDLPSQMTTYAARGDESN